MRHLALAVLLTACPQPSDGGLVDVVETFPEAEPIAPETECVVRTARDPNEDRAHAEVCSAIDYVPSPPGAGAHYGAWADFRVYDQPVPWGFLVHSLEHGAVVLVRGCEDCPEVSAAFAQIASSTDDPLCSAHPNGNRVITVFDPGVGVPIAAAAWGHVYQATCLDMPSLEAFVADHYADAPENLCNPGVANPVCD